MSQPPQYPPPGQPPGWGQPAGGQAPGPGRSNSTVLIVVLVLIAVTVAGGAVFLLTQDDDDDGSTSASDRSSDDDASSGGASSPDEQAFIDALTEANEGSLPGAITSEEARCMAEATVDVVGLEALQAATTPDEINADSNLIDFGIGLDQAQTGELADATSECVDWMQIVLDSAQAQGATQEGLDCLEANLDADLVATSSMAEYAGSQEVRDTASAELNDVIAPCEQLGN